MSTLVIQSYRTVDVPNWVITCQDQVKGLARQNSWDYAFRDDSLFDIAPTTLKTLCGDNLFALTDICRLLWIQEELKVYEQVIWFDIDVLVFKPEKFKLTDVKGYGFAHELLILPKQADGYTVYESVNNSVMSFRRGSSALELYLQSTERVLLDSNGQPSRCALGPELLQRMPWANGSILQGIGLFTYEVMRNMCKDARQTLAVYDKLAGAETTAANLCHFMRGSIPTREFDLTYSIAIDALLGAV